MQSERPHLANSRALLLLTASLVLLDGCQIPNRMYRTGDAAHPAVIQVPAPPALPIDPRASSAPVPDQPCKEGDLLNTPCVAFLEFDDFGEVWQKGKTGHPQQLNQIEHLIREAKDQDPQGQPLILLFVHGWKHNASEGKSTDGDDPNILGLEAELNELHEQHTGKWKGHVVIGIYIAWRGGLISPFWPVAQNFTYWNREATAARVGNTSMTEALIEIADTARSQPACMADKDGKLPPCGHNPVCAAASLSGQDASNSLCQPRVVYVGHSFGALVMERALSQATITRMENEYNTQHPPTKSPVPGEAKESEQPNEAPKVCKDTVEVRPLVDLVIYVNSAAAAIESKQMMDYFAYSRYRYHPYDREEPLFLSVTSEADTATGALLKVGHAVPLLGYKYNGSMRGTTDPKKQTPPYSRVCFDPDKDENHSYTRSDLSQSDYFMSTTAHKEELWSHDITATPLTQATPPVSGTDPTCEPGKDGVYINCVIGQKYYTVTAKKDRCNGTPYWVMQVDKDIIPDHGTIFTKRLLAFLMPFVPSPSAGQPPKQANMSSCEVNP